MLSLWVVFSAAVALSRATTVDDCPINLIRGASLLASNGYCYYFATDKSLTYKAANEACKHNGGTLALVKTEEIQDVLYNRLTYGLGFWGEVFIGLNDVQTEGKYMWEDGTSLGKWQNWAPGYGPEDKTLDTKFSWMRDCVTLDITKGGKWVDQHCESGWLFGENRPFICQFKAIPTKKTNKPSTSLPITPNPTTAKPTTLKPTTPKPTTSKPTSPKHTTPKPTTPKLTTTKPTTPKLTTQKLTTPKLTTPTPKPTTPKPTTSKPTTSKPTTSNPTTSKLTSPTQTTPTPSTTMPTTPKLTTPRQITQKLTTQTSTTLQPTCPPFVCPTDCSMDGYKNDPVTGCAVCECDI